MARRVVESLIKEGKVVRGYLGVRIQPLDMALARKLDLPNNRGALVTDVQPGSPGRASRAASRTTWSSKLAGHEVADPGGLKKLTASLDVGSEVPVDFYRDGKPRDRPGHRSPSFRLSPRCCRSFGFGVRERPATRTTATARAIEIDQVVTGGPAFQEGLRPGTRILAVGEKPAPVSTLVEFEVAVRKLDPSRGLALVVQSTDGRPRSPCVRVARKPRIDS